MKIINATLMIIIMSILTATTFAEESTNTVRLSELTLKQKMVNYQRMREPILLEIKNLQTQMVEDGSKFGFDFSLMENEVLKRFIENQKKYVIHKQILTDELYRIYFPSHEINMKPIDKELESVLAAATKNNCNFISKLINQCLKEQESLIFKAEYLDQKIEELEIIEATLMSEINTLLLQEDLSQSLSL